MVRGDDSESMRMMIFLWEELRRMKFNHQKRIARCADDIENKFRNLAMVMWCTGTVRRVLF